MKIYFSFDGFWDQIGEDTRLRKHTPQAALPQIVIHINSNHEKSTGLPKTSLDLTMEFSHLFSQYERVPETSLEFPLHIGKRAA